MRSDRGHTLTAQCPAHNDQHPSLDITTAKDGKALLICRSNGCALTDILTPLGLTPKDLYPTSNTSSTSSSRHRTPDPGQHRQHVADYHYTVNDTPLIRKRRYTLADGTKTFTIQHRTTPTSPWRNGQAGLTADPYNLPALHDAPPTRAIFIVEGEKDADRLTQLGLTATTNIGGAGKWPTGWGQTHFTGRQTIIIPDNDPAGHTHAETAAHDIAPHAATLRLIHLPDLPPKGDITDWLDQGHTLEHLKELVATTPLWTPPPPPQPEPSRFRLITIDELLALPEPGWLIEHILPEQSFGLIVAPPKQGKTYLLLDWMLHIASGIDWHHGEPINPGHVVYITGEGITGLARRIRAWQSHNGTPPGLADQFHIVPTMPRVARDGELDELQTQIDDKLAGHQPAIIAFDTYARLAAGLDENSAQDMGHVCAVLEDIRDHYHCTTLAAHHTTKDGLDFRGSSAIDGSLDFMTTTKIVAAEPDDHLIVKSKYMKSWEPHPPITLEFRKWDESGFLVPREQLRETIHLATYLNALATALARSEPDTWILTSTVREHSDLTRPEFSRTTKTLVRQGIIEARGNTTKREVRWTEHGHILHSRGKTNSRANSRDSPAHSRGEGGSLKGPPSRERASKQTEPKTIEEII